MEYKYQALYKEAESKNSTYKLNCKTPFSNTINTYHNTITLKRLPCQMLKPLSAQQLLVSKVAILGTLSIYLLYKLLLTHS